MIPFGTVPDGARHATKRPPNGPAVPKPPDRAPRLPLTAAMQLGQTPSYGVTLPTPAELLGAGAEGLHARRDISRRALARALRAIHYVRRGEHLPKSMREARTLGSELLTALALVFAGALVVAAVGIIIVVPRLESAVAATAYITTLLVLDVVVFAAFGRHLLQRWVLTPLQELVRGAEAIAEGEDRAGPIQADGTVEMARLARAVDRMADRLIAHRKQLAENVRSLELTNRQLTEARDELVRAEKMASVGRLGAGIAHEVGNPLSAILGYLAVIRRIQTDPRCAEYLDAAEMEARRIDRIVSGLLDYARPREARPRPIQVKEVVEGTVELLENQGQFGGIDVEVEVAEELPGVVADPHQLQQVLVNLLLNARDAVQSVSRPRIDVRARRMPVPVVQRSPARRRDDPPDVDYSHRRRFHNVPRLPRDLPATKGDVIAISVTDNGPGVPEALIDQVFEPFVTTKEPGQGTGLGLAVSARLVDAMGGTIRLENAAGGGAVFTIILQVANETAEQP